MGLPAFIPPMLARLGRSFDSPAHFYEVKWDGFRALAFVEGGEVRLMSRRGLDLLPRFPELRDLATLPEGCVLDGEIVILRRGKADFHALLAREQVKEVPRARSSSPAARYIAFDLLYRDFEPWGKRPFEERRAGLEDLLRSRKPRSLTLSEGVVGRGKELFAECTRSGHEGVVAKRLDSRYLPGKRTDAWTKFKRRQSLLCVVIGYEPSPGGDLKSLHLAAQVEGKLRYVGKVGSGWSEEERIQLEKLLQPHRRKTPLVPCPLKGVWVEPRCYCEVSYAELTPTGMLRAPVLERVHWEAPPGRPPG